MRASCTCSLPRNCPSVGRRTFYRHHHRPDRTAREQNSGLRAHYDGIVTRSPPQRANAFANAAAHGGPVSAAVPTWRPPKTASARAPLGGGCLQKTARGHAVARCERTCSRGGVFFPVPHTYGGRSHSNVRSP